jgi:ketosteroid isomerase-like protein
MKEFWILLFMAGCCATVAASSPALEHDTQSLLEIHARARQAHLKGDANLLVASMADHVINVEYGKVEIVTRDQMRQHFTQYFDRVKYSSWENTAPPKVYVSPDAHMAWMAIEIKARLSDRSGPSAGVERGFISSWIATFEKQQREWRMVGISSGVVEDEPASAVPTATEILDAAEQALGKDDARASIRSISAVAACHGPKGDYETRIISDRNGNLSFQQFFSDHKNIEGILDGRGWQLDDSGRSESVDTIEASVIRGHEFPMMALDLRRRFHDFKSVGRAQFEGQTATQIAMTDDLGNPASAYFSITSHLPVGVISTNPRTGKPATIRFDTWRLLNGVNLVSHVTILYGGEAWVFDFKTLTLNTADNKVFQISETPTGSLEPK